MEGNLQPNPLHTSPITSAPPNLIMDLQPQSETIRSSSEELINANSAPPRPSKRARVTLACQRCKNRKQKCDGIHPSCGSCNRLGVECKYIVPLVPKPGERKLYIKALEDRVAELESYLASEGHMGVGEDHWRKSQLAKESLQGGTLQAGKQPDDEIDSLLHAVRDLSLSQSGYYLGGTNTIALGRALGSAVSAERRPRDNPNPRTLAPDALPEMIGPFFVTTNVANRLIHGYHRHIATRYPCLHTPRINELHAKREETLDVYDKSILHLVYACGGRFLETTGETGNFFCDEHYDAALDCMDEILNFRDLRSIAYLLMLAVYCLRAPRDPGSWTYSSLAMRRCVDLGIHRRHNRRLLTMDGEHAKRIFWTCYYLDHDVSIALGRPPDLSDHDIDVELPLDIDEHIDDSTAVVRAALHIEDRPPNPPTSLSAFVHLTRLKRIESEIQHRIYRVDRTPNTSPKVIQGFLDRLYAWKDALPYECYTREYDENEPMDGIATYIIPYHRTVRFLLYPLLSKSPINLQYLKLCAEACCGLCEAYKKLHHKMHFGPSPLSLQSVFLSGITLTYCAWLAPPNFLQVSQPLTDCSIMLYVMTERFPSARKYRDVFERIKKSITELIASGKHQPRHAVEVVDADTLNQFTGMDQGLMGNSQADLTQMINEMTADRAAFQRPPEMMRSSDGSSSHFEGMQGAGMGSMLDMNGQQILQLENNGMEGSGLDNINYEQFSNDWSAQAMADNLDVDYAGVWGSAAE